MTMRAAYAIISIFTMKGVKGMYYTMLDYYLNLFDNGKRAFAFQAETPEAYAAWKSALRARLAEITGLNRCIPCEPVHELVKTEQAEGFTAEYHTLQTEPGVVMPFYLMRPEANGVQPAGGKRPVLIVPHGHGGGKRQILGYQGRFIREALEDGFIVACPDERGSGDRREFPEQGDEPQQVRGNSHRELMQLGLNFGRTVIGGAVWDLMRLSDWLLALPEASGFLACAGMSGGGQQTLWFAALDDRVNAAITSGYFYGVRDSLIELPQNCACNFVPHFFETADMGELGALIAPRPFFVESGANDPLSGKRRVANVTEQLDVTRAAYRLFGAEDRVVHSVHDGGHEWRGDGMRAFLRRAMAD